VIDLHCHVLPGVDDGPSTLTEAVAMCRLAAEDGCTTLVATPHQRHPSFPEVTRAGLEQAWRDLTAALAGVVEVRLGAEVRVDSELLAELHDSPGARAADAEVLSLGGSRYLLLELSRGEAPPAPEELVHELVVAGWSPVIAHPEVIPWLSGDLDRLAELVFAGALLQVTAASLLGEFGRPPRDAAWAMANAGLVHFVASDSHSTTWRKPGLSTVRALLERRLGAETARRLLVDNPGCVLADAPLALAVEGGSPA
jgi:protein-tyrosine phosphatase